MQISGLQNAQAVGSVQKTQAANQAANQVESTAPPQSIGADQLDLSAEAQQLSQAQSAGNVQSTDGIRTEKVAALRQAIAEGSYETPEKLSAALDNMLDAFA